jgi:hypothetical protein
MKKNILCSLLCLISAVAFAQSITLTPTSAGTNTEGKMFYSTTTHTFHYWNGTSFISLGGSSSGPGWSVNGNDIINANTGNIGIGVSSPLSQLHIKLGHSGVTPSLSSPFFLESGTNNYLGIATPSAFESGILFGKPNFGSASGGIIYNASSNMDLRTGGNFNRMTITSDGLVGIHGNKALEFGYGVVGKEVSAGKIGYGLFTPNTLDIVGAGGNFYGSRKVKVWAEGGSEFNGNVDVSGFTNLGAGSPKIKMKLITGTAPLANSTAVFYPHGLDATKIISFSAILGCCNTGTFWIPNGDHNYNSPTETSFDVSCGATDVRIGFGPNMNFGYLGGQPFRVLIIYIE